MKTLRGLDGWPRRGAARRRSLWKPGLGLCAALLWLGAIGGRAAERPNILLILCDDMGYSDLGCYGSEIRTPNIDSLARSGLRFTQFHNTSKCWTTRASLLTGKYWQRIAPGKFIVEECPTLPELLRAVGYRTYMSGKWHLAPGLYRELKHTPAARGFEKFYGILRGATSYYDPDTLTRGFEPIRAPRDGKFYFTDAINDDAARNIREHARTSPDRPFFMYLAHTAPHWPMQAPAEDIEKYLGVYDAGWEALRRKRFERMKELGVIAANARLSPANAKVKDWDRVDRKWEAHRMAVYAAMIDRLDQGIGRVIAALKETGAFDNTLILFLSDNWASPENIGGKNGVNCLGGKAQTREGKPIQVGYAPGVYPGGEETFQGYGPSWANASCTPFRWWKATSHEGGVASPFIAHWPRAIRERGSINRRDFAHLIDLLPTCLELAGAPYPSRFKGAPLTPPDGVSLVKCLTRGEALKPRVVFNEFARKAFVREGDWKLVTSSVPGGEWELYHLKDDPTELRDLSAAEPGRLERMKQAYVKWYTGTGMKMPKPKKRKKK